MGTWEHMAILEGNKGTRAPLRDPLLWACGKDVCMQARHSLCQCGDSEGLFSHPRKPGSRNTAENLSWSCVNSRKLFSSMCAYFGESSVSAL